MRTAPAMSRYSSRCAVGVTARVCALGSMKVWLDSGSDAASAWPMALSQPVTPPIFMMSIMARSLASAATEFAMPRANHQFSPV